MCDFCSDRGPLWPSNWSLLCIACIACACFCSTLVHEIFAILWSISCHGMLFYAYLWMITPYCNVEVVSYLQKPQLFVCIGQGCWNMIYDWFMIDTAMIGVICLQTIADLAIVYNIQSILCKFQCQKSCLHYLSVCYTILPFWITHEVQLWSIDTRSM